jgi:diketogulonate reductase-like aldo/keto reductase
LKTAKQTKASPAQVALAWLQAQPGVTSTIIGARTLAQLEDNVKALEVKLTKDQLKALSELTTPTLDFPAAFISRAGNFSSGGATINGEHFDPTPMAPKDDSDRY